MPDNPSNQTPTPSDNSLEAALQALADLVQSQNTSNVVDPSLSDIQLFLFIRYLLLMWASFRVYQIEPYAAEGRASAGKGGGSSGGSAKIIDLGNGRKIFDYGSYLATSPGENYGSYCTGKLIESAQKIMQILAERGAKRVGFTGHPIAQLAAWMESLESNIQVVNYYPSAADQEKHNRIRKQREESAKRIQAEIAQRHL